MMTPFINNEMVHHTLPKQIERTQLYYFKSVQWTDSGMLCDFEVTKLFWFDLSMLKSRKTYEWFISSLFVSISLDSQGEAKKKICIMARLFWYIDLFWYENIIWPWRLMIIWYRLILEQEKLVFWNMSQIELSFHGHWSKLRTKAKTIEWLDNYCKVGKK